MNRPRHRFKFDEFNDLYPLLIVNRGTIFHQDDTKQ
jgi:hypothetical protein